MVFVPLTSPGTDFYGGDRKGANLFSNCVVALDCKTGRRRWHFQTVHHDLWDWDLPAQPSLVTVRRSGREIPAVAQITKLGFVYLLDRLTGRPLFEVQERPVPPSKIPGEHSSPTQPLSGETSSFCPANHDHGRHHGCHIRVPGRVPGDGEGRPGGRAPCFVPSGPG